MSYTSPNASDGYRADARECLDRAQRALEVAEINLDIVAELFKANETRVLFGDLIAHAEARTRVGRAWADLGFRKSVVDSRLRES